MKTLLVTSGAFALMVACGSILGKGDSANKAQAEETQVEACHCEDKVVTLETQLHSCEQERVKLVEAPPKVKTYTKVIEKEVPVKQDCNIKIPDIKPVHRTECKKGYACYDQSNQTALLANELKYRTLLQSVQDCQKKTE